MKITSCLNKYNYSLNVSATTAFIYNFSPAQNLNVDFNSRMKRMKRPWIFKYEECRNNFKSKQMVFNLHQHFAYLCNEV